MTPRSLTALAFASALLLAGPALAQVGIPGSGPLTPDGPRRGLGPPSITDNVPDLRLQPSGGGSTFTPPTYGGGSYPSGIYRGRSAGSGDLGLGNRPRAIKRVGRHCRTPKRVCALSRSAAAGSACSCRAPGSARVRGMVVR